MIVELRRLSLTAELIDQTLQFTTVRSDQLPFQGTCLEFHHDVVVIRTDEAVASLKVRYLQYLRVRQMQGILDTQCFIILQIEDDFGFGIVDDALTKPTIIKIEEVIQILAGKHSRAAETTNGLGNLQKEITCKAGACCTSTGKKLPTLIDKDGLFFRPILLGPVPNKVQRYKHTDGQQVSRKGGNVQNGVLVIQRYICLLVEGAGRTVDKTIQDVGKPLGTLCLNKNEIEVTQNRHLPVLTGIIRIIQRCVIMGDPFCVVGSDHGIIQELPFLVVHIRDQQAEKDMKLLDLLSQFGKLDTSTVQKLIDRLIYLPNLHDIDAMGTGRGDLDELTAHIGTGTMKFMAFQRSDDKDRDSFSPHTQRHELHGEGLSRTAGAKNGDIGI